MTSADALLVLDTEQNRTASLIGVYLMGFYNVAWVMMISLVSSNNAGLTKKAFASTSVAVIYGRKCCSMVVHAS